MANILYRFCETALESKSTKAKRTWWASFNGTLNSTWFLGLLHIVTIRRQQLFVFQCSTFSCLQLRSLLFQRRKWLLRFGQFFFCLPLVHCKIWHNCSLVNNTYWVWSVQWVHWTELVVNDICCQYEVVFENLMSYWKRQCSISLG